MNRLRRSRAVALMICAGMLLPGSWARGEEREAKATRPTKAAIQPGPIQDVALGGDGALEGMVIGAAGTPIAGAPVLVAQKGNHVATSKTGKDGHFSVPGLRGGVYQVSSARGTGLFRVWTQDSAPPAARQLATVVAEPSVVRGQMPLSQLFRTDVVVIGTIIAAGIAIPLLVHASRDDDSGS